MPYRDKEKQKQWMLTYYSANKTAYLFLKDRPCHDCGMKYPHYMMHLDHVRGKKYKNMSELSFKGMSSPRFISELAKCDLVCANCHAQRTYFRTIVSRSTS